MSSMTMAPRTACPVVQSVASAALIFEAAYDTENMLMAKRASNRYLTVMLAVILLATMRSPLADIKVNI
jgi:hypothetical protein